MREFAEGQDVIAATEIAGAMGINPYEVSIDHETAAKFKEVVDYLTPFEDRTYIATKLARGKTKEDAIEHVWRYVGLRREYESTKNKLASLTNEIQLYE